MLASDRLNYIGSSDVPIILGISSFKTRFQLWLEKTSKAAAPPMSYLMEEGTEQEPYIGARYERETGYQIVKPPRKTHPDYPFLGAAVDFMALDDDDRYSHIVECKMVTIAAQHKWLEGIPPDYFAQVQHQLLVWNMQHAQIVPLFTGMMELDIRDIYADPDYQELIIEKCLEFQGWVERKEEPPATNEAEARLKYTNPRPDSKLVADERLIHLVGEYDELHAQFEIVTSELSAVKAQIMDAMGEHTRLVDIDGVPLFRWTPKRNPDHFDRKAFAAAHPAIAGEFTTPGGHTRQFVRAK